MPISKIRECKTVENYFCNYILVNYTDLRNNRFVALCIKFEQWFQNI